MICTTLNKIRKYKPSESGWKKLLSGLDKTEADDEDDAMGEQTSSIEPVRRGVGAREPRPRG
jgi:hypothetical protein